MGKLAGRQQQRCICQHQDQGLQSGLVFCRSMPGKLDRPTLLNPERMAARASCPGGKSSGASVSTSASAAALAAFFASATCCSVTPSRAELPAPVVPFRSCTAHMHDVRLLMLLRPTMRMQRVLTHQRSWGMITLAPSIIPQTRASTTSSCRACQQYLFLLPGCEVSPWGRSRPWLHGGSM